MNQALLNELNRIKNRNVRKLVEETILPEVIDNINDYAGGMMRHIQKDLTEREALQSMEMLEEMHVKELIYCLRMWLKGSEAVRGVIKV
jgi:hypothetical protein